MDTSFEQLCQAIEATAEEDMVSLLPELREVKNGGHILIRFLKKKNFTAEQVVTLFYGMFDEEPTVYSMGKLMNSTENIICGFIKGKNTPVEILSFCARSMNFIVQHTAVAHAGTPLEDVLWAVRENESLIPPAASNPNIPEPLYREWAASIRHHDRAGAAENPKAPVDVIETLSDDKDFLVRVRLAENFTTPAHIKFKLLNDTNPYVVEAAQKTIANLDDKTFLSMFSKESQDIVEGISRSWAVKLATDGLLVAA